jgi:hypothetical protein
VLLVLVLMALAARPGDALARRQLQRDPDAYRELAWNLNEVDVRHVAGNSPADRGRHSPILFAINGAVLCPWPIVRPHPVLLSVFHHLPEPNAAYGLFHVLQRRHGDRGVSAG